jgi:hypothetical protein
MLDGKLRIAPTCYHVAHQVPVMVDGLGNENHRPQLQGIANRTINAGSQFQFQIVATDVDEPSTNLAFSFEGSNHGATLSSSGLFSWTPAWDTAEETDFTFRVKATDSGLPELSASQEFSIRVLPISPLNVRIDGTNLGSKSARWNALAGATGYIVERRIDGGAVVQYTDWNGTNQQWQLVRVG